MKNEMKQELTRRLCECNNGGLVLVLYDIYFAFSLDVRNALGSGDSAALKKGVADVQAALDELMGALDFKYSVAGQLYPLYSYCKRLFSTALYSLEVAVVDEADGIMKKLRESFEIAAGQDKSAPLMGNAQKVYAGMTYERTDLTENFMNDENRGFLA